MLLLFIDSVVVLKWHVLYVSIRKFDSGYDHESQVHADFKSSFYCGNLTALFALFPGGAEYSSS